MQMMKLGELVQTWVESFNRADALVNFYTKDAVNRQVAETPVYGQTAIREMFISGFASATMVRII